VAETKLRNIYIFFKEHFEKLLAEKPKFHGSAYFRGKTTNSIARLNILRAAENHVLY